MTRYSETNENDAVRTIAARWVARRDAGLSAPERAELERWLADDQRHRSAFEQFSQSWGTLDRNGGEAKQLVLQELSSRTRRRRSRRRMQTAGACLVLLALGSFAFWRTPLGESSPEKGALVTRSALQGPERRQLPDGSVVELNAGSDIAVNFTEGTRAVTLLRGVAHFQVAKNPARPFVVLAGTIQARAIGTAFAVDLRDTRVEVLVTEGHVTVEQVAPHPSADTPKTAPEPLALLGVGEGIAVNLSPNQLATAAVTTISPSEVVERLAWRSPRLEFSGTPLAEALDLLNRASAAARPARVRVVVDPADSVLAAEPISGLFRTDNTEAFVHVLELSLGLRAERTGQNEITLRRAK